MVVIDYEKRHAQPTTTRKREPTVQGTRALSLSVGAIQLPSRNVTVNPSHAKQKRRRFLFVHFFGEDTQLFGFGKDIFLILKC